MPLAHSASGSSGGPVHSASAASSNVPGSGGGGASSNQIFSLTGAITNPTIHQQQHHHHHQSHPTSDSLLLALRQKPTARLFRALFQYIPVRDSPNDNPQLELPLQAGEYILVHGEMDEDQFYHGETLDGQSGLVPSNYVERVTDQQLLSNSSRAPSPSFPLIVPPHLTQIAHDFSTPCTSQQPLPDSVCPYPPVDITKVTVQEIRQTETPRG
ncbi:unnamed protein product [Dracunculus medinensis]|uniref:SH3 domain-containing protein n=1 Tax=Dracunculus medinensis TaxID=318479 RepID=A0A0N4UA87_DRAME|nr:unnamed protein product [Dracunculus medinensis]